MAKRIYVADDEKNICFLIQNFLEKEGFEVDALRTGNRSWRPVRSRCRISVSWT